MTDELFKEFIEYFGDSLPNPEHYPNSFYHYIRLFKHLKGIKQ